MKENNSSGNDEHNSLMKKNDEIKHRMLKTVDKRKVTSYHSNQLFF